MHSGFGQQYTTDTQLIRDARPRRASRDCANWCRQSPPLKTDKPRRYLPFVAGVTYFTFSRRVHFSAYKARVQLNSGDGVGFVFKHICQGKILFKAYDLLRTSLLTKSTVGAQRSVKIMG